MIKKHLTPLALIIALALPPLCAQDAECSEHASFFASLAQGDTTAVQNYIQAHPEAVHTQNDKQESPLHVAAGHGSAEIVELLLRAGAHKAARDTNVSTPLHHAARKGDVATIQLLVTNGASVNETDLEHNTPIHVAAEKGNFSAVRYLVGADSTTINAENFDDDTPLHLACTSGNRRLVAFLTVQGTHLEARNSYGQTPLCRATAEGHTSVVCFLLENGAQFDGALINAAAAAGHVSVVQFLLTRYPCCLDSPDSHGLTPLENGVKHLHLPVVNLLVHAGAKTDGAHGRSVLELCRKAPSLSLYDQAPAIIAQNEKKRNHMIRFLFYNGVPLGGTGNSLLETTPGVKQIIENYNRAIMDSLPENMPRDLKPLILSFVSPVKVSQPGKRKREAESQADDVIDESNQKKQRQE